MYPEPNEHGSYQSKELTEHIEYKSGREYAYIAILQVGDSAWVYAVSIQYKNGGMGEPLSKYRTHETCAEALDKALKYIQEYTKTCAPDISQWSAQHRVHLTAFGASAEKHFRQMSLFAEALA